MGRTSSWPLGAVVLIIGIPSAQVLEIGVQVAAEPRSGQHFAPRLEVPSGRRLARLPRSSVSPGASGNVKLGCWLWETFRRSAGIQVALTPGMLKLLGSYALAKLLGFGLVGAIVIYALLSLVTR